MSETNITVGSALFLVNGVVLMLLATARFQTDTPAFFWSLIVLAGLMFFD